jgi:hypothetical protein
MLQDDNAEIHVAAGMTSGACWRTPSHQVSRKLPSAPSGKSSNSCRPTIPRCSKWAAGVAASSRRGAAGPDPDRAGRLALALRYHQQRRQHLHRLQTRRHRTSWTTDCDFAASLIALPLIGADSDDDVPAKPKHAASASAMTKERMFAS